MCGSASGFQQQLRADGTPGPRPGAAPYDDDDGPPADLDCPIGPIGEITVSFGCDSNTVYSCKDLSNVVLEYEDSERERFEGLAGHSASFSGTGDHEGERVVRVWVKAGASFSGDGPGYGGRFEAPEGQCEDDPPGEDDPCNDNNPDTFCDDLEAPPSGDPLDCVSDPEEPGCQVE